MFFERKYNDLESLFKLNFQPKSLSSSLFPHLFMSVYLILVVANFKFGYIDKRLHDTSVLNDFFGNLLGKFLIMFFFTASTLRLFSLKT